MTDAGMHEGHSLPDRMVGADLVGSRGIGAITKTAATAFNRYFLSGEMILNAIFVIAAMAWFIQVSSRFWKTWIRVAHFESYVLTVPREMRNFALERIAEHLANGDDDAFR